MFSLLTLASTIGIIASLNYFTETKNFYKTEKNVKYIAVGNSLTECAFNDSFIKNFKNFGESGESYFYIYLKTKKLLENNPNIETVFIQFSFGQIASSSDSSIWSDVYLGWKFPKYSMGMNYYDYSILARNNPSGLLNAQSLSVLKNYRMLSKKKRSINDYEWGAFVGLTNNGSDELKSLEVIDKIDTSLAECSFVNIQYLLKTIDICNKYKVNVILLRPPVHKTYMGLTSEFTVKYILDHKLSGIKFWDYKDYPLKDSQFADEQHLNIEGAQKFSIFFNSEIKNKMSN